MNTTMKINDILTESPLPDDWDSTIYNDRVPFKHRVEYAKERAIQLGRGSSRVVFKIPYQGRKTALKVAANRKGMAQNEAEAMLLEDYILRDLGIVIPLIDYDESSAYPTWIHVEKAEKARKSDFQRILGARMEEVFNYVIWASGKNLWTSMGDVSAEAFEDRVNTDHDVIQGLIFLISNYDIQVADLERITNWGIYRGRLVIIDIGLTDDVYTSYYR